jgi:hypothetical protein
MTNHLDGSKVLQLAQARLTWHAAPHKAADNDNDYPPAVPAQAAAAMPVLDLSITADGLLR